MLTHDPLQLVVVPVHWDAHVPPWQTSVAEQALVQVPQCSWSLPLLVSQPSAAFMLQSA